MKLTAVVVIRNEAPYLISFFEHLRIFCDEILVVDQQSTDNSLQLSLLFADTVFVSPNVGWNELDKGWGVDNAKHDWVVILDPDERFSNITIQNLEKAVKGAEKEDCDSIGFTVQTFWDGIPVEYGSIPQWRIVKKGIANATRIHSNFLPSKLYRTPLVQYHLKEAAKHEKRLNERQKLDYKNINQETIKKSEITYFKEATSAINKEKDYWTEKREDFMKQLKQNSYLRLKNDETK